MPSDILNHSTIGGARASTTSSIPRSQRAIGIPRGAHCASQPVYQVCGSTTYGTPSSPACAGEPDHVVESITGHLSGRASAEQDGEEAERHHSVAEAALRAGDFTTALKELERAVELAPRNAMMFYNLAVVHQKRGDAIKALSPLQRAITLGLPEHLGPLAKTLEGELIYARDRARRSLSESVEWLQQQRPSALVAAGNFGGRFEFVHRGFVFNGSGCGLGGYEWRSEDIDPQNARQTVARALDLLGDFGGWRVTRFEGVSRNVGELFAGTDPSYYVVTIAFKGQTRPVDIVSSSRETANRIGRTIQTAAELCSLNP
jgi:hypothetical protein